LYPGDEVAGKGKKKKRRDGKEKGEGVWLERDILVETVG